MGLFTWLVVGVIVGWLAGIVIKGKSFGLLGNIAVGIVGALKGGWLSGAFFKFKTPSALLTLPPLLWLFWVL